jgi:hypothetical protein
MEIEKFKPKIHRNPDNCTENCEKNCDMECMICRKTPWDTKYYYIVEGENDNIQLCEDCFEKLKKEIRK